MSLLVEMILAQLSAGYEAVALLVEMILTHLFCWLQGSVCTRGNDSYPSVLLATGQWLYTRGNDSYPAALLATRQSLYSRK